MQAVVNQSFHLILFIWGTKSGIDIVEGHARITNFKATILWTLYIGTKLLKWYYFMHAWNMCMTFPKASSKPIGIESEDNKKYNVAISQ